MANVKISQLPSVASLSGSEEVPVVQSGATKKTTVQAIADLASGGGGGLAPLDIVADGSIGGPFSLQYYLSSTVPATINGSVSLPVEVSPYISISGGGGYGGSFTATTVSFPTVKSAYNFSINGSNTLQIVGAPLLETISGGLNLSDNTVLASVNFPKLTYINQSLNFGNNPAGMNLNFPLLSSFTLQLNGNARLYNINNSKFPAVTTFTFNDYGNDTTVVDLPTVTTLKGLYLGNQMIQTINLPGVITTTSNYFSNYLPQLSTFILGTAGVTKSFGTNNVYYQFNNSPLNQASVDNILTVLASLDGTNGTTASNNGTVYLNGYCAAPSSTGYAAKSILQGRGFYVVTN